MRILLPIIALTTLLAACEKPPATTPPPRPALTIIAGEQATLPPVGIVGEVRPRYESAQGFRIAGKIVERRVDVGSLVKKGQILARLDAADTGLSAQAAQAEVRAAEADLALAKSELDRQRQLHARKFISAAALDVREAQYKSSEARVQQTRAQAAVSGNQSRYTTLTADRDGVVTEIRAEPGQVVEAGEVVARIANQEELEVVVALPESRMADVSVSKDVQVRLWVAPEKALHGKIREIAPTADTATRTFQVRVSILDADPSLRMGMTAGVRFASTDSAGLLLPTPAVTNRDGKTIVWVVDPKTNQVQPRPVQVGTYREDGIPILSGIAAGERVVVAGVHALVAGQVVRPVVAGAAQ
jgi:RND family efflux transporter MFP subunit